MGNLSTRNMGAGKLDRKIAIYESVEGTTETGGPLTTYTEWKRVWSAVEYMSTNEKEVATQSTSITQVAFKIRYVKGLDAKKIIQYKNRVYDILGILEIEGRNNYLEIRTKQSEIANGVLSDTQVPTAGDGQTAVGPDGMAPIGGEI